MRKSRFFKVLPFLIATLTVFAPLLTAQAGANASFFDTVYYAQPVLADINAASEPYSADPNGDRDSTTAIQQALDDCAATGGGTVFLPAGQYLITAPISIPPFVTLHGDWRDPDDGGIAGTVLLAAAPYSEDYPGLITVGGSAGAVGLNIFYPEQSIKNVIPYPYTFYISGENDSHMLQTIRDCTLINSYNGIGASVSGEQAHEQCTIENVNGTVLNTGLLSNNESDVGTINDLTFSADLWLSAGSEYNAPLPHELRAFMLKNTSALVLGDLEWAQFYNISISDCFCGVKFTAGKRISYSGAFYGLYVSDCEYGIIAEKNSLDARWGVSLSGSVIEGRSSAVINNSSGGISVADSQILGAYEKNALKIVSVCQDTDEGTEELFSLAHGNPAPLLYTVTADTTGGLDASSAIQSALNKAGVTGGIVYLPGGKYRLDDCLEIPAGVELRGSSSVATRNQAYNSNGTLLLSYYGYCDMPSPLITLAGENAGVSGLRILYPENAPQLIGRKWTYKETSYAVLGIAKGVYIENVEICAASAGVCMRRADNFVIKKLIGFCYDNMIRAEECCGGYIEGCQQNGNFLSRIGLKLEGMPGYENWPDERDLQRCVFDPISKKKTEYIQLDCCLFITGINLFAYGVNSLVDSVDSREVCFINFGADNLGGVLLSVDGGDFEGINMMRCYGRSYSDENHAMLSLCNRITIGRKYREGNVENAEYTSALLLQDSYIDTLKENLRAG